MRSEKIDEKFLCKKYRTNVGRLIRAWKKGFSDMEIARETGIDLLKLQHIKTDIELAHRRLRLARKKEAAHGQSTGQRHIFFNPFT
ncbi:MAG: hypothetical protein ACOY40_15290 [Bacillota bacterium]